MFQWIPLMVMGAFAAGASLLLARIKRRPEKEKLWSWLCFFLPVALPILTFTSRGPVQKPPRPWFLTLLMLPPLIGVNLLILVQVAASVMMSFYVGNVVGLPSCSSTYVERAVGETREQTRASQNYAFIVELSDVQEVVPEPTDGFYVGNSKIVGERHCTALARLNTGTPSRVQYAIYERVGNYQAYRDVVGILMFTRFSPSTEYFIPWRRTTT